jgi:hypothetical protein
VTTRSELQLSDDRDEAISAVESIASGKGWCNVVPGVVDDVADLKVNVFGLWVNQGVAVASFVTSAPRHGEVLPSSLGILHSRGRLGRERITLLLGGAPFTLRQDHNARGLVLDVPADTNADKVLDVMCSMTASLCDFAMTGSWRMDLYVRS